MAHAAREHRPPADDFFTLVTLPDRPPPDDASEPPPAEPRSRRDRARDWVDERRLRLERARGTSPTVGVAFDALSYDTDTGAPVLAAALGFRVFLFQVPYACVFVIIAGFIGDATGRDASSFFHGQGITHLMANAVSGAAELSGWARVSALFLALYATFLSARSFLKVVNIVHALVWDVPRTRLPHASRAALMFIALVTVMATLALAIVQLRQRAVVGGIIALALYMAVPFMLWWFTSWWLPHRPCPLITFAPGAAAFAVGFEALHVVTVVWFPHYVESKSDVYGSIGIALVLLLWAYLLGRIMTLAAVLNVALWARFGTGSEHPLNPKRPSWRVPLVDDKVGKLWTVLFGDTTDHERTP